MEKIEKKKKNKLNAKQELTQKQEKRQIESKTNKLKKEKLVV